MTTVSTFLWLHEKSAEAAAFYASVFGTATTDAPGLSGSVTLPGGMNLLLFDGGPYFTLNEAASLFVSVETQDEVDHYWEVLAGGGAHGQCGWLKDRFGVSWQIVPTALHRLLTDPDPARAARTHEAMMGMTKLVIADLEAAAAG